MEGVEAGSRHEQGASILDEVGAPSLEIPDPDRVPLRADAKLNPTDVRQVLVLCLQQRTPDQPQAVKRVLLFCQQDPLAMSLAGGRASDTLAAAPELLIPPSRPTSV